MTSTETKIDETPVYCIDCKSNCMESKEVTEKILYELSPQDITKMILEYLKFKELMVLHSYCDKNMVVKHHYICKECKDLLFEFTNSCDTPFAECPGCTRVLYIGC